MAKKRIKRSMNKIQPAEQTFFFRIAVPGGGTTINYIDLSQCASLLNRRFYRQGLNWAVSGFKLLSDQGFSGRVQIQKLPNTWTMSNAWEKSFRVWNKQQMDAIEEAGAQSAVARFRDFKIHMNVDHVTNTFANNLLPSDSFGTVAAPGEWDPSQIVIPNQTLDASGSRVDPSEYLLHAVGVNDNAGVSRGIIEGYADSRAYPQSPDPVAPPIDSFNNWMRDMFDVGNDNQEITENATERNNNLPYPQVDYPGGETQLPNLPTHDESKISGTTIGGTTYLKGGNFPCGLIQLAVQNEQVETQFVSVLIDMVPGEHRGYLTEPMSEM